MHHDARPSPQSTHTGASSPTGQSAGERGSYANPLQAGRAAAVLDGIRRIGRPSPRILDLGCGTGWLPAILGQFGPTTGVDLSPLAIEQAKKRSPELEFLAGNLFDVPLPHGAFDIVVTSQVIEHVEDQPRFVDLLADLLRPDGHLLLVTDNAWNLARWDQEALARFAGALWEHAPGIWRLERPASGASTDPLPRPPRRHGQPLELLGRETCGEGELLVRSPANGCGKSTKKKGHSPLQRRKTRHPR